MIYFKKQNRRRTCPKCGSENVAEYVYGYVVPDEKILQQEAEGKIIFAGCCIRDDDPKYHCNACGENFGKREDW